MDRALRASDADRQRVVAALEMHTSAGRLRLDEFEARVAAALDAVTLGDLATVTADLPDGVSPGVHPAGSDPAAAARHLLVILLLAGLMLIVLGVTLAVAR